MARQPLPLLPIRDPNLRHCVNATGTSHILEKYWQQDHDAQISKLFSMGLTPLWRKRPRSDEYLNQERARQGYVSTFGSSSHYYEEFHQIKEIGRGDFSYVYKVLKRLDSYLYAVNIPISIC
ncbi:hypothetical protein SELMODRAFT_407172 [Selaginella moellendorffii]|uniref:Protein kinase domain-containing protein n=1 Tax=Selaginella moellendorffii TaxID=88036 RepID=D8R450_SELML|nr:hypothetical protein SELMODRAFT_407172 [Selaginella moellendorffii]